MLICGALTDAKGSGDACPSGASGIGAEVVVLRKIGSYCRPLGGAGLGWECEIAQGGIDAGAPSFWSSPMPPVARRVVLRGTGSYCRPLGGAEFGWE